MHTLKSSLDINISIGRTAEFTGQVEVNKAVTRRIWHFPKGGGGGDNSTEKKMKNIFQLSLR